MLDSTAFEGTLNEAKATVRPWTLTTNEGEDYQTHPQAPWVVHSVQVDWIGCRVSIVCTRIADHYSSKYWTDETGLTRYETLHGAGLAVHTLKDD